MWEVSDILNDLKASQRAAILDFIGAVRSPAQASQMSLPRKEKTPAPRLDLRATKFMTLRHLPKK